VIAQQIHQEVRSFGPREHATESVAAKTGDWLRGLLDFMLGNPTEFVIAIAAFQASQHTLVKASVAGAILTNWLFTAGPSVPPRQSVVSPSGIQQGRGAISVRCGFSRHNRASDSVHRGRVRRPRLPSIWCTWVRPELTMAECHTGS
jgi:hypothetical protein